MHLLIVRNTREYRNCYIFYTITTFFKNGIYYMVILIAKPPPIYNKIITIFIIKQMWQNIFIYMI